MTVYVSSMMLRSMRMIGEKARGDGLTTDEQSECLYELNSMVESWGLERLMCYQVLQENFSLTAGTGSYTIGSGATFNTARPVKVVDPCFVRDSSNLDSPLTLLYAEQYGQIVQKTAGTTYPSYLFYDGAYDSSGYGTIRLYPVPSANLTLFINSWKQLQTFAAVSTALSMPPGYQLAIESNFAIHLAAGQTQVSPEVIKIAKESKAAIKTVNLPTTISRMDAGNGVVISRGSATNIFTGP